MTSPLATMILVPALLCAAPFAAAQEPKAADVQDELRQLKERAKDRYPTLARLTDAGVVGETWDGRVEVVEASHADEPTDPQDKSSQTVKAFLEQENADRARLYELLARDKPVSPAEVARENGKRNFQKAKPEHHLKGKDGAWIKRKDLKAKDSG